MNKTKLKAAQKFCQNPTALVNHGFLGSDPAKLPKRRQDWSASVAKGLSHSEELHVDLIDSSALNFPDLIVQEVSSLSSFD